MSFPLPETAKAEITERFLRPAREAVASTARRLAILDREHPLLSPDELGLVVAALVNGPGDRARI